MKKDRKKIVFFNWIFFLSDGFYNTDIEREKVTRVWLKVNNIYTV